MTHCYSRPTLTQQFIMQICMRMGFIGQHMSLANCQAIVLAIILLKVSWKRKEMSRTIIENRKYDLGGT